jgi:O-antigen/teichoic acid export membrane protein
VSKDPRSARSDLDATPASPRLLQLFARGASWKIGSQSFSQVLRLATTIVLVRLLAPADYGLAAMALVLASFAVAFSDVGFGAAIVQRANLTGIDISTAFWISIGAGALFSAMTAALAEPLAAIYRQPAVAPLILGLSPIFLLDSFATTQRALLARAVDFRSLELRSLVAVVVGSGAAIFAALQGAGAWSLIIQELVAAIAGTLLLWRISAWRPSFEFSRESMRDLGGYAWRKMSARSLSDLTDTADNLVVGRFLGASPLAIYVVAYKTALRPMVNLVSPLQEVLFPVLARVQHDARRVGNAWLRVTRLTCAIAFPLLAGVAVLAQEFVHVVFGSKWAASAEVIQILAVVGAAQVLTGGIGSVLGALGAMRLSLRIAVARTGLNLAAFLVGVHWGIVGVATAFAISSVIMLIPTIALTGRRVRVSSFAFFQALAGVAQATVIMTIVLLLLRQLLLSEGLGAWPRLALLVASGALVYLAVIAWRDRAIRNDMRRVAFMVTFPGDEADVVIRSRHRLLPRRTVRAPGG